MRRVSRISRVQTLDDEELVDVFLSEADVDGDGEITFIEFALATASRSGRLRIADAPLYSWRGHMLDTSRHFIPVEQILTLLDGMYAAK